MEILSKSLDSVNLIDGNVKKKSICDYLTEIIYDAHI